jgi:hypothetical protein
MKLNNREEDIRASAIKYDDQLTIKVFYNVNQPKRTTKEVVRLIHFWRKSKPKGFII